MKVFSSIILSELTLKTAFVAISETVKTAGELLTSSLFHRTRGHLTDKLIVSCFRHECYGVEV